MLSNNAEVWKKIFHSLINSIDTTLKKDFFFVKCKYFFEKAPTTAVPVVRFSSENVLICVISKIIPFEFKMFVSNFTWRPSINEVTHLEEVLHKPI